MTGFARVVSLAAAALLLAAGCATSRGSAASGAGTVVSIHESQQTNAGAQAVGTISGAVVGALLGSQIGAGTGQIIASTVGGVGGSMAGGAIANRAGAETVWDITVRFDDGIDRTVRVSEKPTVRPGDRVSVANGTVTPQ
jgi:outer membrane lipoprotein SlyB